MEILILWISTSIASIGMEIANELRMFKDIADEGYKIDITRLKELGKELNPDASKTTFLSLLIPIFNIMQVFQRTIQYNNIRHTILDQLDVLNLLDEMSEIEKQEYLKNPTGLNAFLIPMKAEIRLAKALTFKIKNENEDSEIFYEVGDSIEDITILRVNGDAAKLTVEEQKKKIIDSLTKMATLLAKEYSDKETFMNDLSNNNSIIVNKNKETEATQKLSINDEKQSLENLKKEILTQNTDTTTYTKENENIKKLVKKPDKKN